MVQWQLPLTSTFQLVIRVPLRLIIKYSYWTATGLNQNKQYTNMCCLVSLSTTLKTYMGEREQFLSYLLIVLLFLMPFYIVYRKDSLYLYCCLGYLWRNISVWRICILKYFVFSITKKEYIVNKIITKYLFLVGVVSYPLSEISIF